MKKNLIISTMSLLCMFFMVACNGSNGSNTAKAQPAGTNSSVEAVALASVPVSVPAEYNQPVNNAYLKVIPNNALIVAKVEADNLLGKSQVLNNTIVKAAFENAIASSPESVKALLRNIYYNPSEAGVNVNAPAYLAVVDAEKEQFVITFAMDNASSFEKVLSSVWAGPFTKQNVAGMNVVNTGENECSLAYDNEKLLLVFDKVLANVSPYTILTPELMAVNDKKFAPLFDSNDDIKFMLNVGAVIDMLIRSGEIESSLLPFAAMAKDFAIYSSANFETGYAISKTNTNLPAELLALSNSILRTPTHRHYGYIPANSFAVVNYNYDLTKLYPVLASTGIMTKLASEGINEQTAMLLLGALSGDYTAAAWIDGDDFDSIQFMAAVDCSDRTLFDLLVSYLIYEKGATMVDSDVYALHLNRKKVYNQTTYDYTVVEEGYDYYIMYKDNAIMVMPENYYDKMNVCGELKPLANSAKNNRLFAYMNEDIVIDAKPLRDVALKSIRKKENGPTEEERAAIEVLNMIDNVTIDSNGPDLDIRLNTVNKNTNSLKLIVDKAISIAIQNSQR